MPGWVSMRKVSHLPPAKIISVLTKAAPALVSFVAMAQHRRGPAAARLFLLHHRQGLPARRHVAADQRRAQRLQGHALGAVDDLRRQVFVAEAGDESGELSAQRHDGSFREERVGVYFSSSIEHETFARCMPEALPHSSHWGAFSVLAARRGIEIVPHPRDPDPSPLLGNIPASVSHRARIAEPMVRRGWLERGPGPDRRRGREPSSRSTGRRRSICVAAELRRVYAAHGPQAVFGGSYGWASAGRFHDAQSQLHRFLNMAGGYVRSVNSYSSGAAR